MSLTYIYLGKLYSTLPVRFNVSLLFRFSCFIVTPKKLKLDFNISTAKQMLWFKNVLGKSLQTTEWTTNSYKFWCLCKRFPKFYIKWIKVSGKTRFRSVIYRYPNTINKFQWQIGCLNSKNFIFLWFVMWKGNGR